MVTTPWFLLHHFRGQGCARRFCNCCFACKYIQCLTYTVQWLSRILPFIILLRIKGQQLLNINFFGGIRPFKGVLQRYQLNLPLWSLGWGCMQGQRSASVCLSGWDWQRWCCGPVWLWFYIWQSNAATLSVWEPTTVIAAMGNGLRHMLKFLLYSLYFLLLIYSVYWTARHLAAIISASFLLLRAFFLDSQ